MSDRSKNISAVFLCKFHRITQFLCLSFLLSDTQYINSLLFRPFLHCIAFFFLFILKLNRKSIERPLTESIYYASKWFRLLRWKFDLRNNRYIPHNLFDWLLIVASVTTIIINGCQLSFQILVGSFLKFLEEVIR